jgi:hypothetical protein
MATTDNGELKHFVAHFSFCFEETLLYLNTELSKGASYQIFVHLASEFQRRRILRN